MLWKNFKNSKRLRIFVIPTTISLAYKGLGGAEINYLEKQNDL